MHISFTSCRSNKHDAAKTISVRLGRAAKMSVFAEKLSLEPSEEEAAGAGAGNMPADPTLEDRLTHGAGQVLTVETLRKHVLPDGAQFRGTW